MPKRNNKTKPEKKTRALPNRKPRTRPHPAPAVVTRLIRRMPPPPQQLRSLRSLGSQPRSVSFGTAETRTRMLANGSRLTMSTETAPVAVSAIDMNREFHLQSAPNGDLHVRFCLPLANVTGSSNSDGYGGAFDGIDALNPSGRWGAGTLLLNPIVLQGLQYTSAGSFESMLSSLSPQLGLQALSYSRYKMNKLAFSFQPQGQTFQVDSISQAMSRLRFAFTAEPTHPILGLLGYRGTGTIGYDVMAETPDYVQFASWNAWHLEINDFHTDWLTLNVPRYVPGVTTFSTGDIAETRQACFGAVSIYDSYQNGSGRTSQPHGALWMSGEIILSDPSPLLTTYVPPQITKLLHEISALSDGGCRAISEEPQEESKEEKKTEIHIKLKEPETPGPEYEYVPDVCSPRYVPVPSRAPGGSQYSAKKPAK